MTDESWKSWVTKHAGVFGFFGVEQIAMLNAWRPIFTAGGFGLDELLEATDLIAKKPPRFASEHLGAIQNAVRDMRAVEYRREVREYEESNGTCGICGGTGRVAVPHLKGVRNGQWVPIKATRSRASYYTQAVLCDCPLGKWMEDRFGVTKDGVKRTMMTLRVYSANNLNWREQMKRRREYLAQIDKVSRTPADEKSIKSDIDKLIAAFGEHGDSWEG